MRNKRRAEIALATVIFAGVVAGFGYGLKSVVQRTKRFFEVKGWCSAIFTKKLWCSAIFYKSARKSVVQCTNIKKTMKNNLTQCGTIQWQTLSTYKFVIAQLFTHKILMHNFCCHCKIKYYCYTLYCFYLKN